ncbi:MAG: ATP-binding protein [Spirochaetaceae bacterium]|nr:ATP-binding protein [Spirochaetaceae bacterium]
MTRNELTDRLSTYEWSNVEFKEAWNAAPKNAYETVSAFANTAGGWLMFSVRDRNGSLEIVGVTESPRSEKPVYLDNDIRRSFIRRGAGHERCTPAEIERFLRDASADRYDGETLSGLDAEEFFDPESVRCYRRVLDERSPGRHEGLSDVEFLNEWGFVVEQGDRLALTRAATLVFWSRAPRTPDTAETGRRLPVHRLSVPLVVDRPAMVRSNRSRGESRPGVADAVRALCETRRTPVWRGRGNAPAG